MKPSNKLAGFLPKKVPSPLQTDTFYVEKAAGGKRERGRGENSLVRAINSGVSRGKATDE